MRSNFVPHSQLIKWRMFLFWQCFQFPNFHQKATENEECEMNTVPFDFDKWMELYQEDPEAFERERQNAISTFLDSVPEERKESLQRLQWRIDAERRRHRSVIGSMVAIHQMMLADLSRLSGSLEVLQALLRGDSASSFFAEKGMATVLPFQRKYLYRIDSPRNCLLASAYASSFIFIPRTVSFCSRSSV